MDESFSKEPDLISSRSMLFQDASFINAKLNMNDNNSHSYSSNQPRDPFRRTTTKMIRLNMFHNADGDHFIRAHQEGIKGEIDKYDNESCRLSRNCDRKRMSRNKLNSLVVKSKSSLNLRTTSPCFRMPSNIKFKSKVFEQNNIDIRTRYNNNSHVIMAILIFSYCIILLASQCTVALGLDCFVCTSRNGSNPLCEDPFHNLQPIRVTTPFIQDRHKPRVIYHAPCFTSRKNRDGLFPASACLKLAGTFENGETLIVRHCGLDSGTLTQDTEIVRMSHCGTFQLDGHHLKGCVMACSTDACNSTPEKVSINHAAMILVMIIGIVFSSSTTIGASIPLVGSS